MAMNGSGSPVTESVTNPLYVAEYETLDSSKAIVAAMSANIRFSANVRSGFPDAKIYQIAIFAKR